MYETSVRDIRAAIAGLDADGLNWRPPAPETNSAAVLTSHALASCRDWVSLATGAPRPARDRDQEFLSHFESEDTAFSLVDAISADTLRILEGAGSVDWGSYFPLAPEPGEPAPTRAFALMHALEHLREHVAHLQLSRQLWDAR